MASLHGVTLARDRTPRFPARCVVCGLPDPDGVIAIRSRGLWESGGNPLTLLRRLFGKPLAVQAPSCASCARDFRSRRFVLRAARWGGAVAGGIAVVAVMRAFGVDLEESWLGGKVFVLLAIVAGILVLVPLEHLLMLPFDVTLRGATVAYEFTDHEVAERFARANDATVED